jgi:hypothetical protein
MSPRRDLGIPGLPKVFCENIEQMAVPATAQLLDAKWGFKELSHHYALLRTPRLCKVLARDRSHQPRENKPSSHSLLAALSIKLDSALNTLD